jgi:hypothetical protein
MQRVLELPATITPLAGVPEPGALVAVEVVVVEGADEVVVVEGADEVVVVEGADEVVVVEGADEVVVVEGADEVVVLGSEIGRTPDGEGGIVLFPALDPLWPLAATEDEGNVGIVEPEEDWAPSLEVAPWALASAPATPEPAAREGPRRPWTRAATSPAPRATACCVDRTAPRRTKNAAPKPFSERLDVPKPAR